MTQALSPEQVAYVERAEYRFREQLENNVGPLAQILQDVAVRHACLESRKEISAMVIAEHETPRLRPVPVPQSPEPKHRLLAGHGWGQARLIASTSTRKRREGMVNGSDLAKWTQALKLTQSLRNARAH